MLSLSDLLCAAAKSVWRSMSDDDLAALEAEIDAEEERISGKRRSAAPAPPKARRAPPPPPAAASQQRSRPPTATAARAAAPANDQAAMLDDDFHDPYDAIDFKHIAQLTASLRQQAAANDDMADEDDSAHLAGISDDAVTADLKAIMRELQAEGEQLDTDDEAADGDEDDELAQLEKEQQMEEEKQPPLLPPPPVTAAQQQTQSRMQSEHIHPTPPVPAVGPPSIEQQLSSLQQQLDGSRRRALDFARAGKKTEAVEVMKSVKVLEARIRQLEARTQPQPTTAALKQDTPAARSSSTPSTVPTTGDSRDVVTQLRSRLVDYQRAAIAQKQAGRLDRAQALLLEIRKMKVLLEEAEKGARVMTVNDIPPHPDVVITQPPRLGRQSSGGGSKAAQTATPGGNPTSVAAAPPPTPPRPAVPRQPLPSSTPSSPPPVPPRSPAGGGLTTKQSLLYEHLIASLTAQAKELQSQVSRLLADAASSSSSSSRSSTSAASANITTDRTQKLLALQYHRLVKRSQADLDLLRTALAKNIPPPNYHTQDEKLTVIHEHSDVPDDQLQLHLLAARDLDPAASYSATLQWEGGGQVVAYSSGSERGPAPEWKGRWPVVFGARTKTVVKAVQRSRVVVVLYRQRLIMGNVEVGRGEMKLKELAGRCDLRGWVKVKDGEAKRVGEVCVEVRMRRPLERMDMREVTKKLLVIDEFEQDAAAHLQPPQPQRPVTSPSSASHNSGSQSPTSQSPSPTSPAPATATTRSTSPTPSTPTSLAAAPPSASPSSPPSAAHPPLPAGVTDADISDPHSILGILSNDVLEWEINTHIPHTLTLARQRQDSAAVEDCMDRLTAAQTQLSILVQAVQAGKLTLEAYLGKLRENIERDGLVARELMRRGRKEDAKLVIQRVQLMRNELKTAEENADELE